MAVILPGQQSLYVKPVSVTPSWPLDCLTTEPPSYSATNTLFHHQYASLSRFTTLAQSHAPVALQSVLGSCWFDRQSWPFTWPPSRLAFRHENSCSPASG